MAKRKAFKSFKPLASSMTEEEMLKMKSKMSKSMKKGKGMKATSKKTGLAKLKVVKAKKLKFKY